MKQTWFRRVLRGLSFTTALFIFQACYGTPQDFGFDLLLEGSVKSKATGLPIKGIRVSVENSLQFYLTDDLGKFSLYTGRVNNLKVIFQDIDSELNGLYQNKDTLLTNFGAKVILDITMDEK